MFAFLDQYTSKGQFTLRKDEDLKTVCNAPKDCPGIYMVYVVKRGNPKLIYIGCSGMEENGMIKIRQDGLWGRLVNGYQFKKDEKRQKRFQSWSSKIVELGIDCLLIKWWNTQKDFPEIVEFCALVEYVHEYKCLPDWNHKLHLKNALHEEFSNYIMKNIRYFPFIGYRM